GQARHFVSLMIWCLMGISNRLMRVASSPVSIARPAACRSCVPRSPLRQRPVPPGLARSGGKAPRKRGEVARPLPARPAGEAVLRLDAVAAPPFDPEPAGVKSPRLFFEPQLPEDKSPRIR